ncbi:hypothetical protein DSO57_1000965 [Entomophthora muscae]|uniref:Uncharacterized protein n=1 Tax=Entomophthora muscae TaxID=34485 RepID=A0ACC2UI39_9FUNG|nr:hypothetical protein DSO57_1000965 [Entomophthora muscae]
MKEAIINLIALSAWSPYSELNFFHRSILKGAFSFLDVATIYAKGIAAIVLPYLLFFTKGWGFWSYCFLAWSMSELLFYLIQLSRLNSLSLQLPPTLTNDKERVSIAHQLLEHIEDIGLDLQGWFRDSNSINRVHLKTFSIYAFFDKLPGALNHDELNNAQEIYDMFQKRFKAKGNITSEETAVMFWPSLNPIPKELRSIVLYTGISVVKSLGFLAMNFSQFKWRPLKSGLSYWIYTPSILDQGHMPILFFHGIGFGPCQYIFHLNHLQHMYPNRTIISLTLPHITSAPHAEISSEISVMEAIDTIIQDNDIKICSVVGHSFGTFIASWMMKWRRSYVGRVTMIDPVCFMTWDSSLYQRILFTHPKNLIHHISTRFIARDPVFASAITRHMNWNNSLTFPEIFDCPTNIFISKKDWVIDAPKVYQYLQNRKMCTPMPNLNVTMLDITHIEYMFDPKLCGMINSKV